MTHLYCIYGLHLESQTEIEGLSPALPSKSLLNSDRIEISLGAPPNWVEAALGLPAEIIYFSRMTSTPGEPAFELAKLGESNFFRFAYADGTRFVLDTQTQRIWGSSPPPLTQEDLFTYLAGPVLGFVLRERGILALHASSFSNGGFAFALCGGQGAGKSTAAAALAIRGVSILCEDITALREKAGIFCASPGYPRVNLWPESATNLFGSRMALPRITPNWEKRFLALDGGAGKFANSERQLAGVYILEERSDDGVPRIEEVPAREATMLLVQNTYMNYLLGKEQRAEEFAALARLASRVRICKLLSPRDPAKIGAMCGLLESDSASLAANLSASPESQRS